MIVAVPVGKTFLNGFIVGEFNGSLLEEKKKGVLLLKKAIMYAPVPMQNKSIGIQPVKPLDVDYTVDNIMKVSVDGVAVYEEEDLSSTFVNDYKAHAQEAYGNIVVANAGMLKNTGIIKG